jgi:hypothetical protein
MPRKNRKAPRNAPPEFPEWIDQKAVAKFLADVQGEDILAVIIRGHLYVEYVLTQLIEEFLAEPRAIEVERLSFKTKVELAIAVGVPIEELRTPLTELNRLRNKLAHNVEATISAQDHDRIFKSFTRETRATIVGGRLSDSISYLHGFLTSTLHYAKEAKRAAR